MLSTLSLFDEEILEPRPDDVDAAAESSYKRTDFPILLPGILGGANIEAAAFGLSVVLEKNCSPLSFWCFKFFKREQNIDR